MPTTKSAKKQLRKSLKRQALNRRVKERVKKLIKGPITEETLPLIYKAIDKAVKRGVFHENKGSRLKSQVAKLLKSKLGR